MKRITFIWLVLALAIVFWLPPAHANLILNGSFEDGTPPAANPGFTNVSAGGTNIANWTVGGGGVDYIGTYWDAQAGSRSIDLSGNTAGSVSQQTFATSSGATYDVSFWLAGNPDSSSDKTIRVTYGTGTNDHKDYTFIQDGHTKHSMGWVEKEFTFVATGASTTLTFASLNANGYGPALDNVQVIPLPPTLLLLGSGLAGLGFMRLRRRASLKA